ncbi:unnamed protein product [Prorocentrum cordatum]|uniref:Armadillo repeat-containing protein 8 n=1 Tax=Prorocentrum cordatum TaxID=2364126 RepID=A0ABN9RJ24_9DINO|nr:unnamed protein product [Polarella glacialis]
MFRPPPGGRGEVSWRGKGFPCRDEDNKPLIAKAGAIPQLVRTLREGSMEARGAAAAALANLASRCPENQDAARAAHGAWRLQGAACSKPCVAGLFRDGPVASLQGVGRRL